jgi:hypothetical protein
MMKWEELDELVRRHGGPFDRGSADSYYRRQRRPHYFQGGTHRSPEILEQDMSAQEIEEYNAGYDWNESQQNFKDYGHEI